MNVQIWGVGLAGALLLFISVYLVVRQRARRNAEVIDAAVAAMRTAMAEEAAPQRALLGAMADLVVRQDRLAARIEVEIHELALGQQDVPQPEEFLKELIDLPEPQLLITGFLAEHGASPGSEGAFGTVAADLVRAAALEVFGDLPGNDPAGGSVELEWVLLHAAEGRIAEVVQAMLEGLDLPGRVPYRAPRAADLDAAYMTDIVRRLDQLVRRHLRLAALLHGQAESALRIRPDQRRSRPGRSALALERLRVSRPRPSGFGPADLDVLVTAFDAVGEAVETAVDYLAEGRPTDAMHVLAGLRIPVPPGLPGRMYHQESLAEVRPLAAFAAWHRLALCRWTVSALRAMAQAEPESAVPPAAEVPSSQARPGHGGG